MKIHVIDGYFIEVDDKNFTLKLDTGRLNKKGKPIVNDIGYYSTVEAAVNKVIQLAVMYENDRLTLKEYIEKLREVKYKIEEKDLKWAKTNLKDF